MGFDLGRSAARSARLPAGTLAGGALLQHRCACGGAAGMDGECVECRQKRLLSRHGGELALKPPGAPAPEKLTQPVPAQPGSRPGYRFDRISIRSDPGKAVEAEPVETGEDKPDPEAGGAATIKCDGKGGYEILLNDYATATCGTKDCVIAHESSHMADWKAKWPTGCKDQPKGYLPKGDPPDDPLMTVAEYNAFLKDSECKAHTADLNCANALKPTKACEGTVKDYIKTTETQKKNWC